MKNKPRNATIVAAEECYFATLEREPFIEILAKIEKKKIDNFINELHQFNIANNYSRIFKKKLSKCFDKITLKRGQFLYEEDTVPDEIFFILEGEVELFKTLWFTVNSEGKIENELNHIRFPTNMPNPFLIERKSKPSAEESIKTKRTSKNHSITIIAPFEIIGAEEIMMDIKTRFISARVYSETATMFRLKLSMLKSIYKMLTSKQK